MIVAKLEDLLNQIPSSSKLQKALEYIKEARAQNLADGRYEIDGDQVYALVQSYTTLVADENSKYEAHQKYIDVQYIAEGREAMGWAPLDCMVVTKLYNPEKDASNGTCPMAVSTIVKVDAGQAAIFFPEDAHAPKLAYGEPCPIKKIVVKVAL